MERRRLRRRRIRNLVENLDQIPLERQEEEIDRRFLTLAIRFRNSARLVNIDRDPIALMNLDFSLFRVAELDGNLNHILLVRRWLGALNDDGTFAKAMGSIEDQGQHIHDGESTKKQTSTKSYTAHEVIQQLATNLSNTYDDGKLIRKLLNNLLKVLLDIHLHADDDDVDIDITNLAVEYPIQPHEDIAVPPAVSGLVASHVCTISSSTLMMPVVSSSMFKPGDDGHVHEQKEASNASSAKPRQTKKDGEDEKAVLTAGNMRCLAPSHSVDISQLQDKETQLGLVGVDYGQETHIEYK